MLANDEVLKRLDKALNFAGGRLGVTDIIDKARRGEFQVWSDDGEQSIVVTALSERPMGRLVEIVAAAGDLDAVMGLQPKIEAFAREHGARGLLQHGRLGWGKVLKNYGWEPLHATYFRPVDGESA